MKNLSTVIRLACLAILGSLISCSEGKQEQQPPKVASYAPVTPNIEKPVLPQTKAEGIDVLYFESRPNEGDVYILAGYDVYVAKSTAKGSVATLFHSGGPSREWVVEKMVWLLRMNKANASYIEHIASSVHKLSFTKQNAFNEEMFDVDGTEHKFVLANSGNNGLYILSYTRHKP